MRRAAAISSSAPVRLASMALALVLSTGCGIFNQVTVEPVATAARRPSNVAAYVAITDGDEPLDQLLPSNFRVYENGQLVPAEQTELTLLDRNTGAAHHALLLVDMSQADKPEARSVAAKAALGFVQKLAPHESVSVFAFDGAEGLVPVASVARGAQVTSMAALEGFSPRDSSRNLNGAVVAGLARLDATLAQSARSVKVGTLVVFASGPDVAGRVDGDKVHDSVWESRHDVIAIGIGEQAENLESLARRGLVRAQAASTLPIAFEEAAYKARAELEKYYLVSYCSPARAGQRRLRLEVTYVNKEGSERKGDFELDFDARGFGPGCNSLAAPRLVMKPKETYGAASPSQASPTPGAANATKKPGADTPDSREQDQGDDAPVPPPDQPGYAK